MTARFRPILIPAALVTLVGCAAHSASERSIAPAARSSEPTESTPSRGFALRQTEPPDADGADAVRLFGDQPESSVPPFEDRLLANLVRHTDTDDGADFDPDIDATGKLLVYATTLHAQRPNICLKRVDGSAITELVSDPADDLQPRFSPDGRRIAFASNRSGNWDIWLVDLDGSRLTQLTSDESDDIAPCWSPDGQTVAFTSWNVRARRWEICSVAPAQPLLRRFLTTGMFPDWSPDGRRLAFQRPRQRGKRLFGIWTVDVNGADVGTPMEIVHSQEFACITPRWSPRSDSIVYASVRDGNDSRYIVSTLWLVSADGGHRIQLTDASALAFNPAFGADGRIYFVSDRAKTENIWSLPVGVSEDASAVRKPPNPPSPQ
ncbi:MAG: Protein TolB [Phycisphaerae bacterium]|nr:Protein TolB [Phycisphaerae bacterium]